MHSYTTDKIQRIWSRESRVRWWLRLEYFWLQSLQSKCALPSEPVQAALKSAAGKGLARFLVECDREEAKASHDVEGFLRAIEARVRKKKMATRYLHLGLTSSDIVDTTMFAQVHESVAEIYVELDRLDRALSRADVPGVRICRTHGQIAESSTWAEYFGKCRIRLQNFRQNTAFVKVSGPTGQSHMLTKGMNHAREDFAHRVGVELAAPVHVSRGDTQVIDRIELVKILHALLAPVLGIEKMVNDLRLHSLLGEVSEGYAAGYVGSSSMPQKKNPIRLERIAGLCRVIRSNIHTIEETAASLWLERDISNSSVERLVLPETFGLVAFVVSEMAQVVSSLTINTAPAEAIVRHGVVESHILVNKLLLAAAFEHRSDAHAFMRDVVKQAEESGHSVRTVLKEVARDHKRGSAILRVL